MIDRNNAPAMFLVFPFIDMVSFKEGGGFENKYTPITKQLENGQYSKLLTDQE